MGLCIVLQILLLVVEFFSVGKGGFVCMIGLFCHLYHRPLIDGFNVLTLICCSGGFAIARKELPAPLYDSMVLLTLGEMVMGPVCRFIPLIDNLINCGDAQHLLNFIDARS